MSQSTTCPECEQYVGNSLDVHRILVHTYRDPASLRPPSQVKRNLRRPRR